MLEKQRNRIDELDGQLVSILEERLAIVTEIAQIKKANQLAILDEEREEKVLKKIRSRVTKTDYEEIIVAVFKDMMNESKRYQKQQQDKEE